MQKKEIEMLKEQTASRHPELQRDSNFLVCDALIHDFVNGVVNIDTLLPAFRGMSDEEKETVRTLANQHVGLCFYDYDVENWSDSVERCNFDDDAAVERIFDNYNFLLELAHDGGEDVLLFLEDIKDHDSFADFACIDAFRNNFVLDSVLKKVLVLMSEDNSQYHIFTDAQKADLLAYPEGTLYFFGEEAVKLTSPIFLYLEIYNRMHPENEIDMNDFSDLDDVQIVLELKSMIGEKEDFTSVERKMSYDYMNYIKLCNGKRTDSLEEVFGLSDKDPNNYQWKIDQPEKLASMFDNPYHPDRNSPKKDSFLLKNLCFFNILSINF